MNASITHITWGAPSFWIERLPLFFGRQMGIFQRQGIRPDIKIFHGGPELMQAVHNGEVHVGEIGLPPFLKAFSEGLSARIIGSTFIQQLDHYVAARPDIPSLSRLKNRKIGILSRGSCDEYFIRKLLTAENLDPETDVALVPLGDRYGDLRCFQTGLIDASFLVEPVLSLGESSGRIRILARVGDRFPEYQWGGIFASTACLESHRDLLDALMRGYRESLLLIKEDMTAAAAYGSTLFKIPEAVFRRALERDCANWELDAGIHTAGLFNCIHVQASSGACRADIQPSDIVVQL